MIVLCAVRACKSLAPALLLHSSFFVPSHLSPYLLSHFCLPLPSSHRFFLFRLILPSFILLTFPFLFFPLLFFLPGPMKLPSTTHLPWKTWWCVKPNQLQNWTIEIQSVAAFYDTVWDVDFCISVLTLLLGDRSPAWDRGIPFCPCPFTSPLRFHAGGHRRWSNLV